MAKEEVESVACLACDADYARFVGSKQNYCRKCVAALPEVLREANETDKSSECVLGLRDGSTIFFTSADIQGAWVVVTVGGRTTSNGIDDGMYLLLGKEDSLQPMPFPEGIAVRVSDIVWCAHAPFGAIPV